MKKNIQYFSFLFITLLVTACSTLNFNQEKKSPYLNKSAREIYASGYKSMTAGNYDDAIKAYQAVESNYPYGKYTTQAQLNTIYCNYKLGQSDAAVQAADRFINLHPNFPQSDYVYYMKGLSKMSGKSNIIGKIVDMPKNQRDTTALMQSFLFFNQFIELYPNSKYAPDARTRMVFLRNELAKHQLYTAEFYYRKKAYVAAANRANLLITHYDHATSLPQGLTLLEQTYQKMGLPKLAHDINEIYRLNYKS